MPAANPARELALSYAHTGRAAARALFALDDQLGSIVARASDPLVGQMRLTWWREALESLDRVPPPAEPILRVLAEQALPCGVTGAALATITDGWEALLEEPFGDAAIERHTIRGSALFGAIATVAGATDPMVNEAGRGWALADLAQHLSEPVLRERVGAKARQHLDAALAHRWSRAGRAIGALALLARQALDGKSSPARRVARLAWHRVTGR